MQTKTTIKNHFTLNRMATLKTTESKYWQEYGEVGTPVHCGGNVK